MPAETGLQLSGGPGEGRVPECWIPACARAVRRLPRGLRGGLRHLNSDAQYASICCTSSGGSGT